MDIDFRPLLWAGLIVGAVGATVIIGGAVLVWRLA